MDLFDSVTISNLTDFTCTIGEVGVDSLLKNGTLRDIPILGSLAALVKTGISMQDRLFSKKVLIFLKALSNASMADRAKLRNLLSSDKERRLFGDNALMLIDKADDMRKAELMGHLWAACAEEKINYDDTVRLCHMTNRVYWNDLYLLRNMKDGVQRKNTTIAESLYATAFVSNIGFDGGTISDPLSAGVRYKRNKFGDIVVEYGISKME